MILKWFPFWFAAPLAAWGILVFANAQLIPIPRGPVLVQELGEEGEGDDENEDQG